jgi:hypothetical protein
MSTQKEIYNYDLHNIVRIRSTHPLPELHYFQVGDLESDPNITVRMGRPSSVRKTDRKSIHYDDGLPRIGFDMDIDYGDAIEVSVSRLVAGSPHVLYTNVIEPLLRWTFVQKGWVLLHAACLAFDGRAVLITAKTDTGKTSTLIQTIQHFPSCEFLSDDMTLIRRDGHVMCYPKPMTISFHTLKAARIARLPLARRAALQIQSRLHSKSGRKIGLALGHSRFPAATLNAIVQWMIPPPKYTINQLIPNATIARTAQLAHALVIERGPDSEGFLNHNEIVHTLSMNAEDAYGFPPYPRIGNQMYLWNGQDLHTQEREIIEQALQGCHARIVRSSNFRWWQAIPAIAQSTDAPRKISTPIVSPADAPVSLRHTHALRL